MPRSIPTEVERIALMDAFLPGVGDWNDVWLLRDLWHFHFYGETPLALVDGPRAHLFRAFLERLRRRSARTRCPEADRRFYAAAYAQPGAHAGGLRGVPRLRAGRRGFRTFAQTKLTMPMLVLTGEKASGEFLIEQGRLVADNVEGVVVKGSGHWLMEEAPDQVIPELVAFINR